MEKIIQVPIAPFGMINAHLVINWDQCILIDTGLPGSESKIEKALKKEWLSLQNIKLIVVTHAHIDHAGSASRLRELTGAPILAHEGDLPYYLQEKPMTFCSTGWFGRIFYKTGLILRPYTPFEPDILLRDHESIRLDTYGIQGIVKHSGGHTAGSISVELDSKSAMVGDLLSSGILLGWIAMRWHAKRPPFEEHPHDVAHELERLVGIGMEQFYMGHGWPLPSREVLRHAQALTSLPEKTIPLN